MNFSHLHCHTQYSLLDGAASISKLFKKAAADNMPAVAITDHGNMFGVLNLLRKQQSKVTKLNRLSVANFIWWMIDTCGLSRKKKKIIADTNCF